MFLRTSKVLKFLALILFAFELVVPVYATGNATEEYAKNEVKVRNAVQHQTLFSLMLLEELNKNEEEKNGHRNIFPGSDCSAFEIRHITFDVHRAVITFFVNSFRQSCTFPALYQVHCKLLI